MSIRKQFLSWACGFCLPVLWKMMRWVEAQTQHRPYLPYRKGEDKKDLASPDIYAALLSGPGIDTIVSLDGSILWQNGQLMTSVYGLRSNGWTGAKLPKDSHTYHVFQYVLTHGPASYRVDFEGVRYAGVAWPLIRDGLVEGVVFRAHPPLPVVDDKSLDEKIQAMDDLVEQARSFAGIRGTRHARVAGSA
jgi:hypothetical protein